ALAKSIIGDTSDCVKGVPGIGAKRALVLVPYYDMILEHCRKLQNGTADPDWTLPKEYVEKYTKIIDKLLNNMDIVQRNLKLIQLPDFFDENHFPDEAERKK